MRKKAILLQERRAEIKRSEGLSHKEGPPLSDSTLQKEEEWEYDDEDAKDPIIDPLDISQGVQNLFREDCEDERDCVAATCSCRNSNALPSTASEDEPAKLGNEYRLVGNVLGESGGEGFGIIDDPRYLRGSNFRGSNKEVL